MLGSLHPGSVDSEKYHLMAYVHQMERGGERERESLTTPVSKQALAGRGAFQRATASKHSDLTVRAHLSASTGAKKFVSKLIRAAEKTKAKGGKCVCVYL